MRTLDEVADTLAFDDDLLVKMDVQGFEDRVIAGGRQTLSRAKACILEVQNVELYSGQPTFKSPFQAMDELGFSFAGTLDQYHEPNGRVVYFDAVFVRR